MASHKKSPIFIRVISNEHTVICINPLQLSSFQIIEKAKIRQKDDHVIEADTIRFFYPTGNGLSYSVGIDITAEEFLYICNTLREYLYLNEAEFKARTAELDQAKLAEWNAIMTDAEAEEKAIIEPKA